MPEGTQFGMFVPICTCMGVVTGWLVMGRLVGKGYYAAAGAGLRTAILLVFWCLVIFALEKMIVDSTRGAYDGPLDAVISAFSIGTAYAIRIATPTVGFILAVGGVLGGFLAEWASKRWN
jgi:hypothetical protein